MKERLVRLEKIPRPSTEIKVWGQITERFRISLNSTTITGRVSRFPVTGYLIRQKIQQEILTKKDKAID